VISRDKASLDFVPGSVEALARFVKLRRAEGHREAVGREGAGRATVGASARCAATPVHFDIIDQAGNTPGVGRRRRAVAGNPRVIPNSACLGSARRCFGVRKTSAALAPGSSAHTISPTMAPRDGEP